MTNLHFASGRRTTLASCPLRFPKMRLETQDIPRPKITCLPLADSRARNIASWVFPFQLGPSGLKNNKMQHCHGVPEVWNGCWSFAYASYTCVFRSHTPWRALSLLLIYWLFRGFRLFCTWILLVISISFQHGALFWHNERIANVLGHCRLCDRHDPIWTWSRCLWWASCHLSCSFNMELIQNRRCDRHIRLPQYPQPQRYNWSHRNRNSRLHPRVLCWRNLDRGNSRLSRQK